MGSTSTTVQGLAALLLARRPPPGREPAAARSELGSGTLLHRADTAPAERPRQAGAAGYVLAGFGNSPRTAIHYGYYLARDRRCSQCGASWQTYEEKMTDVNIAAELLGDAQDDTFDTAVLISADSDLASPVYAVRRRYPGKRVVAAFPPNRASKHLREAASAAFTIGTASYRTGLPKPTATC